MKNHIITKKAPHSHKGATLIGLMIGLLVSMIGILGSLSLYKTLTQTSIDATFDTKHDGNAAITLTLISSAAQNAGFGLLEAVPPVFPHIIRHDATGSLVWRSANVPNIATFNPLAPMAAGVKCQRVVEQFDNANNTRIVLLESVINGANCDGSSDLTALAAAWPANSTSEIISVTSLSRLKADYAKQANSQSLLSYAITPDVNCSPYNAIAPPPGILFSNIELGITHLASVDLNSEKNVDSTAAVGSISHFVCITNS